jgi:4'-phosphopantetheinyl transferase
MTTVRVVHIALDRPSNAGARDAARVVLGHELGIAPGAVEITRECLLCGHPTHGKPRLVNEPSRSFSLSHSGAHALLALGAGDTIVGVDLEAVRPRPYLARLAARTLGPAQLAAWGARPPDERLEFFLRCWTAKEAYLKATGQGVTEKLADVPEEPAGWTLRALAAPAGYVATLAADAPDVAVEESRFSWSDGTAD